MFSFSSFFMVNTKLFLFKNNSIWNNISTTWKEKKKSVTCIRHYTVKIYYIFKHENIGSFPQVSVWFFLIKKIILKIKNEIYEKL